MKPKYKYLTNAQWVNLALAKDNDRPLLQELHGFAAADGFRMHGVYRDGTLGTCPCSRCKDNEKGNFIAALVDTVQKDGAAKVRVTLPAEDVLTTLDEYRNAFRITAKTKPDKLSAIVMNISERRGRVYFTGREGNVTFASSLLINKEGWNGSGMKIAVNPLYLYEAVQGFLNEPKGRVLFELRGPSAPITLVGNDGAVKIAVIMPMWVDGLTPKGGEK